MRDKHPSKITLEGSEPQAGKWPGFDGNREDVDDFGIYPGEGKTIMGD